jgi:hypothetical protein
MIMTPLKSSRRLIAIVATALLLACQTMAVVHACTFGTPYPSTSSAGEPCHDSGNDAGNTTGGNVFETHCQSQHASSAPVAELSILAAIGVQEFTARVDRYAGAIEAVVPAAPRFPRAESPPLTILHCRLRN